MSINLNFEYDTDSEKDLFPTVGALQYTQFPLNGFHCLGGSYTWLSNISGLDQAGCVRDCLWSEECTMLMYNPWEDVCILGSQPCAVAEPHSQLMIQVFRQVEDPECLVPRAGSELDSRSRLVEVKAGLSLARLHRSGNSFVGTSNNKNHRGYFDFDGERNMDTMDHVFLTVLPWCSVAWLPYTDGEAIPLRAVVCARWNGKPAYMLRVMTSYGGYERNMHVSGYPVVSWGVAFDILIQVWNKKKYVRSNNNHQNIYQW